MHRTSRLPGPVLWLTASLVIHALVAPALSAQLVISEFRVRGPNGANDEFIEISNNSGADHTVAGGGTGYAVAASNGVARCVIPNGTVIPNRGHYLCVNSVGYSLASYPAGNGTTATGDATYTTDIPDNAGIAIFNTSVSANFVLANRLDAVGSTSEANTLYKEGTGYPALTPAIKRKIFGLNGARVYGLKPEEMRKKLARDRVQKTKLEYLDHPDPAFVTYGPRTRREFLVFRALHGEMP